MPRREAEAHAFACCVVEWLNRNPARSLPGRCLGCGQADLAQDPLLPFGTESSGHAWLHSRCWPAWHVRRKAESVAALAVWASCRQPNFQTISRKIGVHDGRASIRRRPGWGRQIQSKSSGLANATCYTDDKDGGRNARLVNGPKQNGAGAAGHRRTA